MKKILVIISVFFLMFLFLDVSFAWCNQKADDSFAVWSALDECLQWSALVDGTGLEIKKDSNVAQTIKSWINNISLYLWILAVWSIVLGSLMMTLSGGEDEKLKKWKDIVKWWILWFVLLLSVSAIVNLIVKIMFTI